MRQKPALSNRGPEALCKKVKVLWDLNFSNFLSNEEEKSARNREIVRGRIFRLYIFRTGNSEGREFRPQKVASAAQRTEKKQEVDPKTF